MSLILPPRKSSILDSTIHEIRKVIVILAEFEHNS